MSGIRHAVLPAGHDAFLAHLAALTEAGHVPVCVVIPDAGWLDDDEDEQRHAARLCRLCPALAVCGDYGRAHPREVGVYGGLTQEQRA